MNSTQADSEDQPHHSSSVVNTRPTPKIRGPEDPVFLYKLIMYEIHFIDIHTILSDRPKPPAPKNWDGMQERMFQPRSHLPLVSDEDFKIFQRAERSAREGHGARLVSTYVHGMIDEYPPKSTFVPFNNMTSLTDGTNPPWNPHSYDGAQPEQLDPKIREQLSSFIVPTKRPEDPILPNFFMELPMDGLLQSREAYAIPVRKATYSGALGTRAMHALQSYGHEDASYDGNAYAFSSCYSNAGDLSICAAYACQSTKYPDRAEYFICELDHFCISADLEAFRAGVTAFRNIRDLAREQRDDAIRKANNKARGIDESVAVDSSHANAPPDAEGARPDSQPVRYPRIRVQTRKRKALKRT
ncbi:MAG: hypothetical protein M1822_007397 [Bathelium mastoideum]|nr:MAG: hypothetical protein M1822_007397 [Bathelium mastoideum]